MSAFSTELASPIPSFIDLEWICNPTARFEVVEQARSTLVMQKTRDPNPLWSVALKNMSTYLEQDHFGHNKLIMPSMILFSFCLSHTVVSALVTM